MKLKIFKSLWGAPTITEELIATYVGKGYQGIEFKSLVAVQHNSFGKWLGKYKLDFIAQIHTEGTTVQEHLYSMESLINTALTLDPLFINSQSGCDYWNLTEKCRFMETALELEEKYKIPVAHETHRSRMTFSPWDTAEIINAFPQMLICCDFSHWVNVCERLLTTEDACLEKAISASFHLHARVGYQQGPQVPDPRSPEYKTQVEAHEKWWLMIWKSQQKRGLQTCTACPEYGAPYYLHTNPDNGAPVRDIHEISEWTMHKLRELFQTIPNPL